MKASTLLEANDPGAFKIGKSNIAWESISQRSGKMLYISRVCESGGKPFLLGLRYKSRYIKPDTEIEMLDGCPYCGDKKCTSDHK